MTEGIHFLWTLEGIEDVSRASQRHRIPLCEDLGRCVQREDIVVASRVLPDVVAGRHRIVDSLVLVLSIDLDVLHSPNQLTDSDAVGIEGVLLENPRDDVLQLSEVRTDSSDKPNHEFGVLGRNQWAFANGAHLREAGADGRRSGGCWSSAKCDEGMA